MPSYNSFLRLIFGCLVTVFAIFATLGFPGSALAQPQLEYDTLYAGGNYSIRKLPPGSTYRACRAVCRNEKRCKAWSFIKEQGRARKGFSLELGSKFRIRVGKRGHYSPPRCQLKDRVARTRPTPCCISGTKRVKVVDRNHISRVCSRYAEQAVIDNEENMARKCGLEGQRWSASFTRHQNWCKRRGRAAAERATRKRTRALARCDRNRTAYIDESCRRYADTAVDQAKFNKKFDCGFRRVRWHLNRRKYVRECRQMSRAERQRNLDSREDFVGKCLASVDDRGDRYDDDRDRDYARSPEPQNDDYDRGPRVVPNLTKPEYWVSFYGASSGGWSASRNPRMMADVNGDGRADVVGFAGTGVFVSLARNARFSEPRRWVSFYGASSGGWSVSRNPRMMADVNGDGRADVVGFAGTGVYVSLARNGRFSEPRRWVEAFGFRAGGWRTGRHPRMMADVNGDGRADVVGFAGNGVYVSLARRGRFTDPELWVRGFGSSTGGWSVAEHPRMMADVNGDGRADIVGFGNQGVYVSLARRGRFTRPELWVKAFGTRAGGWRTNRHPRMMADVNGDGRADVVGFAGSGVYVSLAQRGRFSEPKVWVNAFGANTGGWQVGKHLRTMADMNGDGRADVVGFAGRGVYVSLAQRGRFAEPQMWVAGYGPRSGGWDVKNHPRMVVDVNGDKRADIVGFADNGVFVSLARRIR